MIVAMLHRSICMTFVAPFRGTISTMLRFPFVVRRHHVAVELTGSAAGSHCRPAVIYRRPLRAIGSRCMFVLDLLSPGLEMMLMLRNPFTFAFTHLNSVRAAIEANAIHVIHHHCPVVVVVNHGHVHVG